MEELPASGVGQFEGEPPRKRITPEEAKERMSKFVPRDDWERRLLAIGTDCGVSLSDEALSSDGLYD